MLSSVSECADNLNKGILELRRPVIFRNQNLGSCLQKWDDWKYLAQGLGSVPVSCHVVNAEVEQMNFVSKNFTYQMLPADELIKRIFEDEHDNFFHEKNERYYLRSLGNNVRKDTADIRRQFTIASEDINWSLFDGIIDDSNYHSSILRIASKKLRVWTHYDVIDNFLFQVVGQRYVTLYSPDDAPYAYLKGDKSLVVDPENWSATKFPKFAQVRLFTCCMNPGDILFIPALWFHHTAMAASSPSVGVNVFWKSPLAPELYSTNDLYGNRDSIPAEQALKMADKIVQLLEKMPKDHSDFYARRICQHILDDRK